MPPPYCAGVYVDEVCWQLSRAGETCEATCGALLAIDYEATIAGNWQEAVVTALTARYNLGYLFWNSPPPPPSPAAASGGATALAAAAHRP